MSQRKQQKAATRAHLIEVARQRFRAAGYTATTLAGIAREAGVAAGTVCAHFPTKSDLVAAAFYEEIQACLDRGSTAVEGSIVDRLLARIRPLFLYYAADLELSRALLRETLFLSGEWEERFRGQVEGFVGELCGLIEAAVERAELSPELDVHLAGVGFFSDYFFALQRLVREAAEGSPAQRAEVALAQVRALTSQRLHGYQGEG